MEYKTGVLIMAAMLAAAAALPKPWGYVAVVVFSTPLWGRVLWLAFRPRLLAAGLAVYAAAFVVDFYVLGPPGWAPPWWEAAVLAPVAEELLFRAVPFAVLPSAAAWVFAVLVFGFLHLENPLLASLYGLALALVYRGGGYAAAVLLHAFNNAVWIALATGGF